MEAADENNVMLENCGVDIKVKVSHDVMQDRKRNVS